MAVDYTTFTEVDEGADITVSSTSIDFTGLGRDKESYVYKDMGVGYFSGDFEHEVDVIITAADSYAGHLSFWSIANIVDDGYSITTSGEDKLGVAFYRDNGTLLISVHEINAGGFTETRSSALSLNTNYYLTIRRDEGIGTYGTLYCDIYSDASRSTLVETTSHALTEKQDFQYIYGLQCRNTGTSSREFTGTFSNLTLYVTDFESTADATATTSADLTTEITMAGFAQGVATTSASIIPGAEFETTPLAEASMYGNLSTQVLFEAAAAASASTAVDLSTLYQSATLDLTFPALSFEGSTGPVAEFTLDLPAFESTLFTGGGLSLEFEALTSEFTALQGQTSEFSLNLPFFTQDFETGAQLDQTMPAIAGEFSGLQGLIATLDARMARLGFNATAKQEVIAILSARLPGLSASFSQTVGSTAELSLTMPFMRGVFEGEAGLTASFDLSFEALSATLTLTHSPTADFTLTLPEMELLMLAEQQGRFDGLILQWSRPS